MASFIEPETIQAANQRLSRTIIFEIIDDSIKYESPGEIHLMMPAICDLALNSKHDMVRVAAISTLTDVLYRVGGLGAAKQRLVFETLSKTILEHSLKGLSAVCMADLLCHFGKNEVLGLDVAFNIAVPALINAERNGWTEEIRENASHSLTRIETASIYHTEMVQQARARAITVDSTSNVKRRMVRRPEDSTRRTKQKI